MRLFGFLIQGVLIMLASLEFILAGFQLPIVINRTHFFDIHSMVALLIFLLAAGFLPVGITKALMQHPTGWFFIILSQIFWFSWAALSIDVLQEILQTMI